MPGIVIYTTHGFSYVRQLPLYPHFQWREPRFRGPKLSEAAELATGKAETEPKQSGSGAALYGLFLRDGGKSVQK